MKVQAANRAFQTWSATPVPRRAAVLFRYKQILEDHADELARLVTRENGKTLDEAIATMNRLRFGNGATIFTANGAAARQFTREIRCGMVGVNVGVPAPMALFPFSGWNQSFFGDLHVQGTEGVMF